MIVWANVRPRFWLWRHQRHSKDLSQRVWVCSCRSTVRAGHLTSRSGA